MSIDDLKLVKGRVICFLNVRSLNANINTLRVDLENSGFLAIGLCETWLNKNLHDDLFRINGYHIVRADRKSKKRGGGLLWYINSNIDYETVNDDLNCSNGDIELLTVIVKPHKQRRFILSLTYLPPSGNRLNAFNKLEDTCMALEDDNCYRVIGGDFNMEYGTGKSNSRNNQLIFSRFEAAFNLTQVITKPTRSTMKCKSIIDLIFTSEKENIASAKVLHYSISDHDLVYINFKKTIPHKERVSFKFRDVKNLNLAKLNHQLTNYNWSEFLNCENPTDCWEILYLAYMKTLDEILPLINMNSVKGKDDWVSKELLDSIKVRDNLRAQNCYSDNPETWKALKKAKNTVRQLANKARQQFTQDKIEAAKNNPSNFWKELKSLMPGKKSTSKTPTVITIKNDQEKTITDPTAAANYANSYCVNIGPKLSQLIKYDNAEYLKDLTEIMDNEITNSISEFEKITEKEVVTLIKKMDTTKASNIDGINNKILKYCLLATIPQICYLFNLILKQAHIPIFWKTATVVPIFKEGCKTDIANYRPISLLPQIVKLFEKIIHSRMMNYLSNNDILCPEQGGFLPMTP